MTQLVITIKDLQDRKYLTLKHLIDSELWDSIFKKYYDSGMLNPRQLIFHATNQIESIPQCVCAKKNDFKGRKIVKLQDPLVESYKRF